MRLLYQGEDITGKVELKRCVMHDHCGGFADYAELTFVDRDKRWTGWAFGGEERLELSFGQFSSGPLYARMGEAAAGAYRLTAVSVPLAARQERTRIRRHATLFGVAGELAADCGMALRRVEVKDVSYACVSQTAQPDTALIMQLCARERYCAKFTGGALYLANERVLEQAPPALVLREEDVLEGACFTRAAEACGAVALRYLDCASGRLVRAEAGAGTGRRLVLREPAGDREEALRVCQNRLENENKALVTAYLPMKFYTGIAAGNTLRLEGFGNGDGVYFITHICYDVLGQKNILEARKVGP